MNKKFYLNDLMKDYFFDVNDLSELWYHDDEGWFTYDEYEAEWFRDLSNAYDVINEQGIVLDDEYVLDYDDIIHYAENFLEGTYDNGEYTFIQDNQDNIETSEKAIIYIKQLIEYIEEFS